MRSFLLLLLCISWILPTGAAQAQSNTSPEPHLSFPQKTAPQKTARESHSQPARREDLQALREDLTRMKALVQQMQSNLAFVDTTQSPLKHQFQLEIDMWQTLITQMERRLGETKQSAR